MFGVLRRLAWDLIHRTTEVAGVAMQVNNPTGTIVIAYGGVREDAVIPTFKRLPLTPYIPTALDPIGSLR